MCNWRTSNVRYLIEDDGTVLDDTHGLIPLEDAILIHEMKSKESERKLIPFGCFTPIKDSLISKKMEQRMDLIRYGEGLLIKR